VVEQLVPIDITATGITQLLPASTNGYKIPRIVLVTDSATVIQFASGVDLLTGPIELNAKGSFVLDQEFLKVAPGEEFLFVQTGTARLGGVFAYKRL
jgi:hypothetical protein